MYKIEKLKSNEILTLRKKYYGKRFLDLHLISASLALICYDKNSFSKAELQYQYVGIYAKLKKTCIRITIDTNTRLIFYYNTVYKNCNCIIFFSLRFELALLRNSNYHESDSRDNVYMNPEYTEAGYNRTQKLEHKLATEKQT